MRNSQAVSGDPAEQPPRGGTGGLGAPVWKNRLIRELALVLAIKLAALYGLWFAFFSEPARTVETPADVERALLGSPQARPHAPTPITTEDARHDR